MYIFIVSDFAFSQHFEVAPWGVQLLAVHLEAPKERRGVDN
ncbi:MAG: hypothetical protein ACD_66C00125G0002 [uncultured bacterium]|nr:MAG: hypothetical protein ACD_66C00125G0002 [uncultured bacterium]